MAWTFTAFRDTAPAGAEIKAMSTTTIIPALILWGMVTTNVAGQYAPAGLSGARPLKEGEKDELAAALGCTRSTVDGFVDMATNNREAFAGIAKFFEAISSPVPVPTATASNQIAFMHVTADTPPENYQGVFCPTDTQPMLAMANSWSGEKD